MDQLENWARARGYRAAQVALASLQAVLDELAARHERGEFAPGIRTRLANALLAKWPLSSRAKSLVLVAVPAPVHSIVFDTGQGELEATVPPTYAYFGNTALMVRTQLQQALGEHFWPARVPLKALAVRAGLARYGRNNLVYVADLGSFIQLLGFESDLEVEPGRAGLEPELLAQCAGCRVCREHCPTGAIGQDRVLLHAEKCLSLVNQAPGDWPDWVLPSVHNSLLGCMACQDLCPANQGRRVKAVLGRVPPAETQALLQGGREAEALQEALEARFRDWGLQCGVEVMSRNLRVLLAQPWQGRRKEGLASDNRGRAGHA
ncbi:MAG: 4Fe-4S double cluster binding domain-containing protein [Bacillota bacterium]